MKRVLNLFLVITLVITTVCLLTVPAAAVDSWDPATFDVASDASNPGTVLFINPAIIWQAQNITASSDYWGPMLGDLKCFMSLNNNLDNRYFVYETKPGAANALAVYYEWGNFNGEHTALLDGRGVKVYTSEDLTSWTEVTGDNLKQTIAGAPDGTNGAFLKVFVGVNEMPASQRYIKFLFPKITPDMASSNIIVGSFLQKGGADYVDHSGDTYYFHDDVSTLDNNFYVGGRSNPGWINWTQPKPDNGNAANNFIGDVMAWPNAYAAGNYVAYRVAPHSKVVFRCDQSVFINEWVNSGIDWLSWTYNSGTYDQSWGFTAQISKDGLNWEDCAYTRESYPLWLGGNFDADNKATTWNDYFCQGHDLVYIGVPELPDDYQFVRLNFPAATKEFSHVAGLLLQVWDVGFNDMIAYSDEANTPAPSTIPGVLEAFQSYITVTSSVDEGNTIVTMKNMTAGQLLSLLTTEGGYTLQVMSKYDEPVGSDEALATGMKVNLCLGDLVLNSFITDTESAEGVIDDVIAQVTEAAELTQAAQLTEAAELTKAAQSEAAESQPSPGTGDSSFPFMVVVISIMLAAVVFTVRKTGKISV